MWIGGIVQSGEKWRKMAVNDDLNVFYVESSTAIFTRRCNFRLFHCYLDRASTLDRMNGYCSFLF